MAKDIYTASLRDIVPSSIASDPQIQAMIAALDPELQGVSQDIRETLIYSRIDELPDAILDLLAWQWHVDFYEPERLSLESKRNLVRSSIPMHRKKGTKWAVEEILRAIGIEPKITEWFEYGGEPYRFRVNGLIQRPLSPGEMWGGDTYSLAIRAIAETKSERSWLDSLDLGILFDFGDIFFRWQCARRREYRTMRTAWSLYPRFDFLPADAMPLDWRPLRGYIRALMTAKTRGWLTGVSNLDRYLHLDHMGADFWPLDMALPYYETDNPPIIVPVRILHAWQARRTIRAPTAATTRKRMAFFLPYAKWSWKKMFSRQSIVAAVSGKLTGVSGLDRYLRFDHIGADLLPLDMTLPHVECKETSIIVPVRVHQKWPSQTVIRAGHATSTTQKSVFVFSARTGDFSGAAKNRQTRTGTGFPRERPSHIDDFLRFDSTPADFIPLDRALPYQEGRLIWR